MLFNRRRSQRPAQARLTSVTGPEALEQRLVMSYTVPFFETIYAPTDIAVPNPITGVRETTSVLNQLSHNPSTQNSLLNNEGKIVSGEDRAGDQWTIVVHGPGEAIVTDITPDDGELDDNIDKIQLIGTSLTSTYVTGTVVASNRVQTSGQVDFNSLVDTGGVRSVILNGFTLTQTIAPTNGNPNNSQTGVFLTGGVQYLSFADIEAPVDPATGDAGVVVQIGSSASPLTVKPTIVLNHIQNTVIPTPTDVTTDGTYGPDTSTTTETVPNDTPQTTPTVSIVVNGVINNFTILSATQTPNIAASDQYLFPIVTTTGRTSVQASAINNVHVKQAATNITFSRSATPFQNGLTGLSKLGTAKFDGPTDAVGIDVNGPIKKLTFNKGLGNPTGVAVATNSSGQTLPQTNDGLPANEVGYAGVGLVSGLVTATKISSVTVKPANVKLQTPSNPAYVQLRQGGEPYYIARNGNALTNAAIVSSGDIGKTSITGDVVNSEVKSGFHYGSYAAGLEGTRAASKLGKLKQDGNDINGVVSASYRASTDQTYGTADDVVGPGKITGGITNGSKIYNTGGTTTLLNSGAGNFAAKKKGGYLPPPETTSRPKDQTLIR